MYVRPSRSITLLVALGVVSIALLVASLGSRPPSPPLTAVAAPARTSPEPAAMRRVPTPQVDSTTLQAIVMLSAGESTPIMSSVPAFEYLSTAQGLSLKAGFGRYHNFTLSDSEPLEKFGFAQSKDALVVVLAGAETFEVFLVIDERPRRVLDLDLTQPWTSPITHVGYANARLTLRGPLDGAPWNHPLLRVYELDGTLVSEGPSPTVPEIGPWIWPDRELQPIVKVCATPNCEGELSKREVRLESMPSGLRAEIEIERSWPGYDRRETCSVVRQTPSPSLRVEHDASAVRLFGRSESGLYVWLFGLDCRLLRVAELPGSVLQTPSRNFAPPPLKSALRASLEGVYFDTSVPCESSCTLSIHEPLAGQPSSFGLIRPREILTGYDERYIWWSYYNDDDWYVYVVDRQTRELLLAEMGAHREHTNPIVGVNVVGSFFSVEIGAFLGMGRLPEHEVRVFNLDTGDLVASHAKR